jgi:prepilin-type N-terminal cleavage/methylation domain-containing protein
MQLKICHKGFTIPELLVWMTIIAILSTLGLLSYIWYTSKTRDTVRSTDVKSITTVLWLNKSKSGKFPSPTQGIPVTYSGATVWTQGVFGKETMIETGKIFWDLKDPKYGNLYTYSVTENQKEYQLWVVYENYGWILSLLSQSSPDFDFKTSQAFASGPFTPLELTPKIWLDAMDVDGDGDTGDNPANNTVLSSWVNKSSAWPTNNPLITTGTLRYTTVWLNSNQRSVFIPENAGLQLINSNITQGDIFYVVQKRDPFSGTDSDGLGLQSSTANNHLIGYNGTRRHALRINSAPNHSTSSPASTSNTTIPYIYSFHTDGTNYTFLDTGNSISVWANNSIASQVWAFNRAWAVTNQGSDLVISEILIFDQKLSDTNRQRVEGYLAHKWGRTSVLPSVHPFKSTPPTSSTPPPPADSVPDAYIFSDMTDVAISTLFSSNTITISWINTVTPLSIIWGEYSINGGAFTSATGSVSVWNTVQVRLTSSPNNSTTSSAILNIGGVTESFSVTTLVADMNPDTFSFSPVNDATPNAMYFSNTITVTWLNVSVPINITGTWAQYRISNGSVTDLTTSTWTVSASSQYDASNSASRAFDNNTTTSWWGNNNTLPAWLLYDFWEGTPQNITEYTLFRNSSQNGWWHNTQHSPRSWTFEGSNNNINWTVLDSENSQSISAWATKRQYSFSNTQFYRYYRIYITEGNHPSQDWVNITEMELMSAGGTSFLTTQSTVQNGDILSVRMPASATPATSKTATLTIWSGSANYVVTTVPPDTSPDDFAFWAVTNAPVSSLQTSNTIIVSWINTGTNISLSGVGQYKINTGSYVTTAWTVYNGDIITLQQTASASNSQTTSSTLTIWNKTATFNVSTAAPPPDTTPDAFVFTDITGASTGTLYVSNTVTISGINTSTPLSITSGSYSKNGAAYTSSAGNVQNGDTVTVRNTSSSSFWASVNTTLNIGGVTDIFTISTLAADTTPDPFTISAVTDADLNKDYTSNPIVISGINVGIPIDISGPGGWKYSINNGPWTNQAWTVYNGDQVRIQLKSLASGNDNVYAILNVNGVTGRFDITTLNPDVTPDVFVFQDVTNANLNSPYISNPITISGINTSVPISIIWWEYRIGGTWSFTTASGTVTNGQQISVRLTSALGGNVTKNAVLTVGSLNDTFSVLTRSFSLWDVKNIETPVSNVSVTGNYNGLLVHTKSGSTHYIVASPSIMAYDLTNPDILHILQENKLVYNGFQNIPSSYTGTELKMNGGFNFPISAPLLYEGDKVDLGWYGWLKQIDEGIKSNYNTFPAYGNIAQYMDDYTLGYLEDIIWNVIGINPIKPFYCSDILSSKLVYNIAQNAKITASPTSFNTYGTWGIANWETSTVWDLDYEYHSQDGNASIFFEWPTPQEIGYIKIYNRTWCCSERLSWANIKLYGVDGNIIYSHALWDTTWDFVVDLDLEWIGQLHQVKTLSLESVGWNTLNLREVEIYLWGNVKDGIYKVDKDGLWGQSPYNVYCDMTTDGGWWTRIGQNYVENGNFEGQNHVVQYTFSWANEPLTDNVIVAEVTMSAPPSLVDAFVLRHNGSVNDSYQLFFPDIPGEYFAQEIRLTAWVKWTTSSVFHNTIDYTSSTAVSQPDYDVIAQEDGWQKHLVRIPLSGLVRDFTWDIWKNIAGPFYVTGLEMEVYYR